MTVTRTLVRLATYPTATTGIQFEGISRAWPERPARVYPRRGSDMTMIPGISGGVFVPGRTVGQDYGSHESAGGFEVNVPLFEESVLTTLTALYNDTQGLLTYTHDWTGAAWNSGGTPYTNLWLVRWDPSSQALVPISFPGFPGKYKATLKFKIIQKLV